MEEHNDARDRKASPLPHNTEAKTTSIEDAVADTFPGRPRTPAERAADQAAFRAREREEQRARTALQLSVLVRDRRNGLPVHGVLVNREPTDARGLHEKHRRMPYPEERIKVHCSTRTKAWRGRLLGDAPFVIHDGKASAVIDIDPSLCVEPREHTWRQRFSGLYVFGSEYSGFLPCSGMPRESDYYNDHKSFWVDIHDAGIRHAITRASGKDIRDNGTHTIYVEWTGTATGPGVYGHIANGLYHLDIEALHAVSATPPKNCAPKGHDNMFWSPVPRD